MPKKKLNKTLGLSDVTFLIIGAIIGSGIFMIPGLAAAAAGVMSIGAWVVVGIVAVLMSLLIAELSSRYDNAGGLHFYVERALGKGVGFIVGWACLIISWVTIAMTVSAGIEYLSYLVPLSGFMKAVIGIAVIWALTGIAFLGVKNSARSQLFFTGVTILVLWAFISLGIFWVSDAHFQIPQFQWSSFALALTLVIEPYIGWEVATFLSEETKNARKTIPKALIIGTLIIAGIYAAVAFISVGILGASALGASSAPLAKVAEALTPHGGILIALGALLIIIGCANSWVTSSARLPFALGREKVLPKIFSKLHEKRKTPYVALIMQALVSSFIIATIGFKGILEMLVPIALFVYFLTFISVPLIRRKKKENKPLFKVPGGTAISIFCALFALGAIIYFLIHKPDAVIDGLSLIALGIPLYFLMKFRHSETFPKLFYSIISRIPGYDALSRTSYGKEITRRMVQGIPIKGRILEVDCKTALLLRDIEDIGDTKLRVGTDLSFTPLVRAKRKIKNAEFVNADTINLPFKTYSFNYVFCMGLSPEVVDLDSFIKEIIRVLKPKGKARILAFGKVLGFESFYSPKRVRNIAEKYGYKARIEREKYGGVDYDFITISSFEGF